MDKLFLHRHGKIVLIAILSLATISFFAYFFYSNSRQSKASFFQCVNGRRCTSNIQCGNTGTCVVNKGIIGSCKCFVPTSTVLPTQPIATATPTPVIVECKYSVCNYGACECDRVDLQIRNTCSQLHCNNNTCLCVPITPSPSVYPTPTPRLLSPTPILPTPTPATSPTSISINQPFTYTLTAQGNFTPNATGNGGGTVTKNVNGYWDYKISVLANNLMPNKQYQLWICGINCSSVTAAQFTTNNQGTGTFTGAVINHAQWNDPIQKIAIWEIQPAGPLPTDPNACFKLSNTSQACLYTPFSIL